MQDDAIAEAGPAVEDWRLGDGMKMRKGSTGVLAVVLLALAMLTVSGCAQGMAYNSSRPSQPIAVDQGGMGGGGGY